MSTSFFHFSAGFCRDNFNVPGIEWWVWRKKEGEESMRRRLPMQKRRYNFVIWLKWGAIAVVITVLLFNAYIDTEVRPTLMKLAEYQARELTLQAIHEAVSQTTEKAGEAYTKLYTESDIGVQMNMEAANRIRSALVQSVQTQMQRLPEQQYTIPFGSLTGNSLLNGHGPGWKVTLRPEGYIEAQWQEKTESLSINTTRYSAIIVLSVTINMILDGRTETLTVTDSVPMVSMLLCGETPSVYAAALD